MIQAAPVSALPDFQLYPQFDIFGLKIDAGDLSPYPSVLTDTWPNSTGTLQGTPGSRAASFPAPPGFRVKAQEDVPGFDVRPDDHLAGFNPEGSRGQREEPTWLPAPPDVPSDIEEWPDHPDPVWPERRGGDIILPPLPPIVSDPTVDPRLPTNPLPALPPYISPWIYPAAPRQSFEVVNGTNNVLMPRISGEAVPRATTEQQKAPLSYGQAFYGLPSRPSGGSAAMSNAVIADTRLGVTPSAKQPIPVHQTPQMQQSSVGILPAEVQLSEVSDFQATPLRRNSAPTNLAEEDTAPKTPEIPNPDSPAVSPLPLQDEKERPQGPSEDWSSLGQKLAQSSIDALIPDAYYQNLARQQFQGGDYLGAAVYQTAALADAALGVATFGLSTRAIAAVRAASAKIPNLFLRSFDSWEAMRRYLGSAPKGMEWHHIVERNKTAQFGQQAIHSTDNIVAIPIEAHREISGFYASKQPFSRPHRVRDWIGSRSFEEQYEYGMERLKQVLGY
ncbi:hypothetical protein BH11PSE3_BH11PSE3_39330 [soil metagenome]